MVQTTLRTYSIDSRSTNSLYTSNFFIAIIYNFIIALNFHNNAIYPLYVTGSGGGAVMVGLFISAYSIAAVLGRPIIGPLIDRFGTKPIMVLGSLCMALPSLGYLALLGTGMGPLVWILRIIQGIGFGAHFSAFFTMVNQTAPSNRRNEAVAMYGISGFGAILIGPLIGERLVILYGLPTFFIVMAIFGCIAAFFATRFNIPKPVNTVSGNTQYIGIVFKTRKLYFPLTLALLMSMSLSAPFTFLAPLAQLRSINGFSLYFTGYAVAGIIIRLIGRKWADQFGWRRILIPTFTLCSIGLIVIYYSQNIIDLFFAGMIIGSSHGLAFPAVTSLGYTMAPEEAKGTSMALVTGMMDFGTFITGIIFGLIAKLGGYGIVFPLSSLAPILAVILLFINVLINPRRLAKVSKQTISNEPIN